MSYYLRLIQVDPYRIDAVHQDQDQVVASAVMDSYGWGVHTRVGRSVCTVARSDFAGLSPAECRLQARGRLHVIAAQRLAGAA